MARSLAKRFDQWRRVEIPPFMAETIEEVVRQARNSPHVSQASGVSVRTSIANMEVAVSNAERRGILTGESHVVPPRLRPERARRELPRQDRNDARRGRCRRGQADQIARR